MKQSLKTNSTMSISQAPCCSMRESDFSVSAVLLLWVGCLCTQCAVILTFTTISQMSNVRTDKARQNNILLVAGP